MFIDNLQIPDKVLEYCPPKTVRDSESSSLQSQPSDDESGNYIIHDESHKVPNNGKPAPRPRRLSTYEDGDAVMDPESRGTRNSTYRRNR